MWLVGVGDPEGPADRRLADLRYPDAVHAGEAIMVEVAVAQHGTTITADDSVTVRLLHEGLEVAARTGPAGDLTRWELSWTSDEPGLAVLTVTVDPLDDERFRANNQMTLAVDASEAQARLLLLGPTAGWDARFLAQAALAEPRLALSTVRAGPEGPVLADSLRRWEAPSTAAAWRNDWDGVVITGSPSALLPGGGPGGQRSALPSP